MRIVYSFRKSIALTVLFCSPFAVSNAQEDGAAIALEEIVVTARRREESLQDTPVSVTALNADAIELRNIQSVADVTNYAPNIQFDSVASESGGGASSQISIRGIGQTDYAITIEPGVGLYLDGVYIGKSMGSLLDAVDLDSIQVLRGPQGTLFGKNTIGGAVVLTSKQPTDEYEGSVDVTVGEFDRLDFKASANLPVSDRFRVRGSFASLTRDGHVDRILTGDTQGNKDALSGRLIASANFTDSLDGTFAVDVSRIREESPGQVILEINESAFFAGLHNTITEPTCDPALADPARLSNPNCANSQYAADIDDLNSTNTGPNQSDADIFGISATFDWDFSAAASLKSITAYREVEVDVAQELVGIPAYRNFVEQDIDLELFSQELQLSGESSDNRLTYIVGLYYGAEEGSQRFPVLLEPADFLSGGLIDNDSLAVFGQLEYAITDALTATVGGRYSTDTKRYTPVQEVLAVPASFQPFWDGLAADTSNGFLVQEGLALFPEVEVEREDKEFTPSLTLDYRFNESVLAYGSYSRGFKGGGFTMRGFPPVIPGVTTTETDPNVLIPNFGPEIADVFELGLKTNFWDGRARLNLAFFSTDYQDIQLTANVGVSSFVPVLINAGDVDINGFEAEGDFALSDWLQVNFGLGILDSEFSSLSQAALDAGTTLDSEVPNSPETTFNFGFTADFFENANSRLFLRADVSYKDSQFKTVANDAVLEQDSYTIVNAALNYSFAERWRSTLGVSNITDEIYIVSGVANGGIGYAQAVVSRPREWFLSVKYEF